VQKYTSAKVDLFLSEYIRFGKKRFVNTFYISVMYCNCNTVVNV